MTTYIFCLNDEITAKIEADNESNARIILQRKIDHLDWLDIPSELSWGLACAY